MDKVFDGYISAEPDMWFRGEYGRVWHKLSYYNVRCNPVKLWFHVLTHGKCGYFVITNGSEQIQSKPKAQLCKACDRLTTKGREPAPIDKPAD